MLGSNDWYDQNYLNLSITGNTKSMSSRIMHRKLEEKLPSDHYSKVLEVGGNVGEHIVFLKHSYSSYTLTDIREIPASIKLPERVNFRVGDIHNLPFDDGTFDRTIVTCVLHHVGNPKAALEEIRRVTKTGGTISLLMPCDPGIAYRFFRYLTSERKARSVSKLDFMKMNHALEHRNHIGSLDRIARNVFQSDHITNERFPLKFNSWNLNLIYYYQIVKSA